MSKIECQFRKGIRRDQHKAKKRSISNRKVKNRYELQEQAEGVGTSSKKLKFSEDNYDVDYDSTFGYRTLCFTTVFSALSDVLVCHTCHKKIKITEASKQGLGFKIVVTCEECELVYIDSYPKVVNKAYEVNRRLIFAMRLLVIGINGIKILLDNRFAVAGISKNL